MNDIYIIILTAFAVFGMYSAVEVFFTLYTAHNSPCSVTLIKYTDSEKTFSKRRYIHNSVDNNSIIIVGESVPDDISDIYTVCRKCEISSVVNRLLFTKSAD